MNGSGLRGKWTQDIFHSQKKRQEADVSMRKEGKRGGYTGSERGLDLLQRFKACSTELTQKKGACHAAFDVG